MEENKQPEKLGPVSIIAILMILGITITNIANAYLGGKISLGYGNVVAIIVFYGIGVFVKKYFLKIYNDATGKNIKENE